MFVPTSTAPFGGCSKSIGSPYPSRSTRSGCITRFRILTDARRHARRLDSRRGIRVEIYPLVRSRGPERQLGRERGAASLPAASERKLARLGKKPVAPPGRTKADRRRQHSHQ